MSTRLPIQVKALISPEKHLKHRDFKLHYPLEKKNIYPFCHINNNSLVLTIKKAQKIPRECFYVPSQ